jgi:hypothetical protein
MTQQQFTIWRSMRGWNLEQYQRRQWWYLRITKIDETRDDFDDYVAHIVLREVREFHPAARVVRCSQTELVLNIGTVFDAIRDSANLP